MIIREIGASLRALFARLSSKTTTIAGTETVYLDDAGSSVKASLSDVIRYGGGNSTRIATVGNSNIHQNSAAAMWLDVAGQTVGNARGAGAFDWQPTRSSATAIASGTSSFTFGASVTASGIYSFAFGNSAISSAAYSVAFGFATNSLNAGQFSFGFSSPGNSRAQGSLQTFYSATSDATLTQLNISGAATDRMVIPATRSVAFIGIVQAMCNVSASSNVIKAWKIEGVITRDGSNTTRIVGTPTITVMAQDADGTQTPSTWAIASITADDTNEALAINVTGQTGQTIRWQATLLYSQVGF